MNAVFFIGNGFDLNCGMRTSYKDIIKEYVKSGSDDEIIASFKDSINKDLDSWGDFEMAMARYAEEFDSEDGFLACLDDFSIFMRRYLEKEEKSFLDRVSVDYEEFLVSEMRKSLSDYYVGITNNVTNIINGYKSLMSPVKYSFISFNYTRTFDKILVYIKHSTSISMMVHVHGYLEDATLGVDNEGQMNLRFEASDKFKRHFIKPYFNEKYDKQRTDRTINAINNADIICVYGMSMGESDLVWRNEIIKWLKTSQDNHLIYYDYNESVRFFDSIDHRMDAEDEAKSRIFKKWGIDDIGLVEQFHIPCGKNIFNIQKTMESSKKQIENKLKRPIENGVT